MKKTLSIYITLAVVLINSWAHAQCYNNINTTSTDWRDYPATSDNDWNWTEPGNAHEVYLDDDLNDPSIHIELPFFCSNPPGSGTCAGTHNVAHHQFHGSIPEHHDIHPEDGWELLIKDFGSPNPDGKAAGGKRVKNPFFILYNKFTGRMKIYIVLMGQVDSWQGAFVRIGFDNADLGTLKSGTNQASRALFSPSTGVQKTALEFNPVTEYKQLNQVNYYQRATDYQWMLCELATSYDPCACQNHANHLEDISQLAVQAVKLSKLDIEAQIDGKSTTSGIGTSGTISFNDLTDATTSVAKAHVDWRDINNTMWQVIDYGNEALYKRLVAQLMKKDNQTWEDLDLSGMDRTAIKKLISDPEEFKALLGADSELNAANGVASVLPYVGAAIALIDVFVDGGKSKESSQVVAGPMTHDVNLSLSGGLTEESVLQNVSFFNPGSDMPNATSPNLVPHYNNILGVFNVLELPELEYGTIKPQLIIPREKLNKDSCMAYFADSSCLGGAERINLRQYKALSNIKYVLNPASEMEVVSIDAAIILEYNGSEELFMTNPKQIGTRTSLPFHDMMTISNVSLADFCNSPLSPENCNPNLSGLERRIQSVENSGNLKLEYVSAGYPSEANSFIRFRTNYVPISCFENLNFALLHSGNHGKVYVKMYVKLKHKTNLEREPVTMIATYDWTEKVKAATENNNVNGKYRALVLHRALNNPSAVRTWCSKALEDEVRSYNIFDYHKDISITKLPFGNIQHYYPDKYVYRGESDLEVKGRLLIPAGAILNSNTKIRAGGLIRIESDVVFAGDNISIKSAVGVENIGNIDIPASCETGVGLLSELMYGCSNYDYASLHNTSEEISTFCNKAQYLDRVYGTNNWTGWPIGDKIMQVSVYPNPNDGEFYVDFEEASNTQIKVTDVNGKVVFSMNNVNNTTVKIDIRELQSGIYFVEVRNDNGVFGRDKVIIN